jgi:hypothetical protein
MEKKMILHKCIDVVVYQPTPDGAEVRVQVRDGGPTMDVIAEVSGGATSEAYRAAAALVSAIAADVERMGYDRFRK